MELFYSLLDFVLHIDQHLVEIVNEYQTWTYLILFLIIFVETGIVVMPFLPGDSLLFAAGMLAAQPNELNVWFTGFLFLGFYFKGSITLTVSRKTSPCFNLSE